MNKYMDLNKSGVDISSFTYKNPWSPFKPVNLDSEIHKLRYEKKVSNLNFIIDTSTDMNAFYRGWRRIDYAYEIMKRIINTLPNFPLEISALVYGDQEQVTDKFNRKTESASLFWSNTLLKHNHSTLNSTLTNFISQTNTYKKNNAVIIISHCQKIDNDTIALAQKLHMLNGNKTCLYMIGAGDVAACYKLIPFGQCGFSVSSDEIANPNNMANFLKKILLKEPEDLDNDGIFDYEDQCLNTPLGQTINSKGCKRSNTYPFKIQE